MKILVETIIYFCIWCVLFSSCQQQAPSLPGFDVAVWKSDIKACKGQREAQLAALAKGKDQLLGKPDYVLTQILGKPERASLNERNQHTLSWYVTPSKECGGIEPIKVIEIKFNAVNLSKEILLVSNQGQMAF